MGRPIERRMLPMQMGDVPATWASPDLLRALIGFVPSTPIDTGVQRFVEWHRERYQDRAPR
jgi:UDP-glucuronate 4-epimerase